MLLMIPQGGLSTRQKRKNEEPSSNQDTSSASSEDYEDLVAKLKNSSRRKGFDASNPKVFEELSSKSLTEEDIQYLKECFDMSTTIEEHNYSEEQSGFHLFKDRHASEGLNLDPTLEREMKEEWTKFNNVESADAKSQPSKSSTSRIVDEPDPNARIIDGKHYLKMEQVPPRTIGIVVGEKSCMEICSFDDTTGGESSYMLYSLFEKLDPKDYILGENTIHARGTDSNFNWKMNTIRIAIGYTKESMKAINIGVCSKDFKPSQPFELRLGRDARKILGIYDVEPMERMKLFNETIPTEDDIINSFPMYSGHKSIHTSNAEKFIKKLEILKQENLNLTNKYAHIDPVKLPIDENDLRKGSVTAQYELPKKFQEPMKDHLMKELEEGIVEFNNSKFTLGYFNSPVWLTFSNKFRKILDVRAINKLFSKSPNTILKIKDILQKITGINVCVYSRIDLKSAFHQILVHRDHRHVLAFTVNGVRYQYKTLPLGLSFVPDLFQSLIQSEIQKAGLDHCVLNYIDDLIVFSCNEAEHLDHVQKVLTMINRLGFKINWDKTELFCHNIKILGHFVCKGLYTIDKEKLANVLIDKRPKTLKQLQMVHGLLNFFRSFCPRFSHLMHPIVSKMNKHYKGVWTSEMEQALQKVVAILTSGVYLKPVNPDYELHLSTDASELGMGGCLHQQINGETNVVCFNSKGFTEDQIANWSIPRKEFYSVVYNMLYYHEFIYGNHFVLHTDSMINVGLFNGLPKKHQQKEIMLSWLGVIQRYCFSVNHVPGLLNILPDSLSRLCFSDLELKKSTMKPSKPVVMEELSVEQDPLDVEKLVEKYHQFAHNGDTALYRLLVHVLGFTQVKLSDCQKVTHSCKKCAMYKSGRIGHYPISMKDNPAYYPMDKLVYDTLILKKTSSGKIGIIVIVCVFTKFCWIFPIEEQTALAACDAFLNVYSLWGVPRRVCSDQGSNFNAEVTNLIRESLLIKNSFTLTASHVGIAEAAVKNVLNQTLLLCAENLGSTDEWDLTADACQYAINTRVMSNGQVPFVLMYGRLPFTNHFGQSGEKTESPTPEKQLTKKDYESKRLELLRNWKMINETIYPTVFASLQKDQQKSDDATNKKKTTFKNKLKSGEFGMYKRSTDLKKTPKMDKKFIGPFRIKRDPSKPYKIILLDQNNQIYKEVKDTQVKRVSIVDKVELVDLTKIDLDSDDSDEEKVTRVTRGRHLISKESSDSEKDESSTVTEKSDPGKKKRLAFPLTFSNSKSIQVDADFKPEFDADNSENDDNHKRRKKKRKKKPSKTIDKKNQGKGSSKK